MFTGIIEGLGTLSAVQFAAQALRLSVTADFDLTGTRIGDSIAVNGACLTAVVLENRRFTVDVSPETVGKTTFATARVGQRVNLERALRLSDRLDGHLVSGHIDGVARLEERKSAGNAVVLTFSAPAELTRYLITKGSVAVDGISLTINQCDACGFQVSVIPHTAAETTVGFKRVGDTFNIETDLIGKYVERFVTGGRTADPQPSPGGVSMDLLGRSGFLK